MSETSRGVVAGAEFTDSHVHVDVTLSSDLSELTTNLAIEMADAGCARAIVLQLLSQPFSAAEWCAAITESPNLVPFVSIDPRARDAKQQVDEAVSQGARGLKIHPRLESIHVMDPLVVDQIRHAGKVGIPVVIDAFFDWKMRQLGVRT